MAKIFGSVDRVKLIRFFLLNSEGVFSSKEISGRTKINLANFRKEVSSLRDAGLVERKTKIHADKKKIIGWRLSLSFPLLGQLKNLLLETTPLSKTELLKKISKVGRVKLVVLSGIFLQKDGSRVDILVVGDKIKKNLLEKVVKQTEAEIGKDLVYAFFTTEDFFYRLKICDKFLRDILDYPHQEILNRLNF